MKEHFVSYSQAVKLKELGFDGNGLKNYIRQGYYKFPNGYISPIKHDGDGILVQFRKEDAERVSAPRLDQAQKWMREVKKIDVLVFNNACGYGWEISKADPQSRGTMIVFFDDNGEDEPSGMWWTYEKALSAGIDKALDLLTDKKRMENE